MHDARTINLYLQIDFCESDARTILPASVGLTQPHPMTINIITLIFRAFFL